MNRNEDELFYRQQRSHLRRAIRDGEIEPGCEGIAAEFANLLGDAADVENELPGQGYEVIREAATDALDDKAESGEER